MARAIWSGSISFGLVNVPVKVFTAVREHSVHFHQLEKGMGSRIRYEKISERTGKEVAAEDIELGYELAKGKLVTVDPDQIEELRPRTTRTIDITDFVDLSEIDPVFYDRTYWLAPDGEAAGRPYWLLVHAMTERRQAGIGTVVMRNKQYLAAVRPRDGALAMSTMHFADEVRGKSDVGSLPSSAAVPGAKELQLATQIIDSLSTDWDPGRYRDTYTNEVKRLVERQAKGGDMVVDEAPVPQGQVLDLLAALEASLKAAGKAKGSPASRQQQMEKAARDMTQAETDADDVKVPGRSSPGRARNKAKKSAPRKSPSRKSA